MYRVIKRFIDLKDGNHAYSVGDTFPRNGVKIDAERLEELASERNRLGVPLIAKKTRQHKAKEEI